jgi:hypothetical protein
MLAPGVFSGGDRWIEIAARTNDAPDFIALASRQKVTPTPYALFAGSAGSLESGGLLGFRI